MAIASEPRPQSWKKILAFAIIYFVWGSTFLAIRIGVKEVPPFLLAAMRFLLAGFVLLLWTVFRREPLPSSREWRSIFLLSILIFVLDYGLVFWAEQHVPSGITAVMMATIPVFVALFEINFLRTQTLTLRLGTALLIGLAGVAVLLSNSLGLSGEAIDGAGAAALLVAAICWAAATLLTRVLPLPKSKLMSSGTQMLTGGVMLTLTAAGLGEFSRFHPAQVSNAAWLSLLYLAIPGSVIAFTVFLWLVHHESPTKVGTHAYVNPVVAVLLGYFVGGEPLGLRTIAGTACVLVSILAITIMRTPKPVADQLAVKR